MQLVDGSRFAAHVDQVRQDDAVSRQVGIAMTDAILRADANLAAVRPLIETAAISVVRSPTFSPVVQGAVREVHDAFTKPGSGVVVLRLADVSSVLSGVVAKVAPQSTAALPSDIDVTLASIGDQSAAQSTISITRRITVLAWLFPVLALGCLGGAARRGVAAGLAQELVARDRARPDRGGRADRAAGRCCLGVRRIGRYQLAVRGVARGGAARAGGTAVVAGCGVARRWGRPAGAGRAGRRRSGGIELAGLVCWSARVPADPGTARRRVGRGGRLRRAATLAGRADHRGRRRHGGAGARAG